MTKKEIKEIGRSNALMAIDQDPTDKSYYVRWHHYMDYSENAKDTVIGQGGNYDQACLASIIFDEMVKKHGFTDWNDWGDCDYQRGRK